MIDLTAKTALSLAPDTEDARLSINVDITKRQWQNLDFPPLSVAKASRFILVYAN